MLLYLSGHTHPDVYFAMNIFPQYIFSTKRSHEFPLKIFSHYLNQTNDFGLVLDPNADVFKVDTYPYSYSSGMYGHEKNTDPECVNSRIVFIVMFVYCPVLWFSKLQTDTDLLTMEEEIIAMAHCCRELFPIINIATSLGMAGSMPMGDTTMNVSVREDNTGALVLAITFPPQFTLCRKYYSTKNLWFCGYIVKLWVNISKIYTIDQLGGLFTKDLVRTKF